TSTAGTVNGGLLTFVVAGVGSPAAPAPVSGGSATVPFLVPGGTHGGTYPIEVSYDGTTAFAPSSDASATLTINKATPAIQWNNAADITVGVPLGPAQLNAAANIPGIFSYAPPTGTVLLAGTGQRLSVTFVPADPTNYSSASDSVLINVNNVKAVPGDLNGDGVVNCADLAIVKAAFGKIKGQPGFDPRADVNGDGVVNVLDLSAVAKLVPAGTVCK